ncbi:MAG: L,D-transpeptidase [Deltaproteobacteria bacterium]|nr:L,D-transpeptidase [Deltaproteobacteria bacterium]MBW1986928.1 L,D-transpeptidase [Deltaproteobacteria bacterium]MBW2134083.1 L,D-transpeptidase [Deltaproteobacteria bacterium]
MMIRPRSLYGIMILVWLLAGCCGHRTPVVHTTLDYQPVPDQEEEVRSEPESEQELIKQVLSQNGYHRQRVKPTILLVTKKTRKLTLYYGTTPIRTYPVVLGANPKKDKLCQGDMCTPEGVYHVVCKYPHERWNKFILLDYPNNQNWLKFARAKKRGQISPLASIGGEIGIHGTDDDLRNIIGENWTFGCISLQNHHLDDIYPLINEKTLVVIKKE